MNPKKRLGALAGLRFVAAAVVALAHLPEVSQDPLLGRVGVRMLSEAVYGLTLFFVLSGFVLAYGYHGRLTRPTRPELRRYYAARVARVWPLHLFTLGLAALLPVSPQLGGVGPMAANVFLVHSWVPDLGYIQSYNSVSWTLSLDAFFYLVFPLIVYAAGRWAAGGPAALYLAACAVWALVSVVVLSHAGGDGVWPLYVCNVCPVVRCGEFAVGVLLGLGFVRGRARPGPETAGRGWWTVVELAAVAAVVLLIFRSHKVPLLYRMNGYYLPAVAVAVAVFARGRGAVSRLLASRPVVYLSDISFAFYLLHGIAFVHLGAALPTWLGAWPKAGVMVLITGLMAAGLFHAVEVPLRERIIRWATPPRGWSSPRKVGTRLRILVPSHLFR